MIRRTWTLCDSSEHIKLYEGIIHKVQEMGYLEGANIPPLYWLKNNKSFGKCSYLVLPNNNWTSDGISLHIAYRNLPVQDALETLVHEVVHFCATYKYGRAGKGHGYYFHMIADKFSRIFNVPLGTYNQDKNVAQKIITSSKSGYKYELYCSKCGKVVRKFKRWNSTLASADFYWHKVCGTEGTLKWRKIKQEV